jgi:capsular exopolysaccharide synthesis family protein
MTPKEVLGILHRHVLLIVIMTVVGLIAGGALWYVLATYFPRYMARTYIEVLPPIEVDPMTITTPQLQRDILYGYRVTIADLINQQNMLEALLGSQKVQATKWFADRGGIRKAYRYLEKYFGAYPHRDSHFVELSMPCRDPQEAADIVNEMVSLFVQSQTTSKTGEIAQKLGKLREQHDSVNRELDVANGELEDIRVKSELTDIEQPATRYFQNTITLRLNDLEIQKNDLDLAIKQIQADIGNLKELAEGPVAEQIKQAIEMDPIMIGLGQQLAYQEALLRGLLTKFGENHREVRQSQEMIDGLRQKREMRRAEIADQTRIANLENAYDRLVVLQQRAAELEILRQEAETKQKDLDRTRVRYDRMVKTRDERRDMLNSLKEQMEKLKIIHDAPETAKVQRAGQALRPLEQVISRQWWIWFPSGVVLGALVGIGLAFLVELANDLVRTPRDVGRYVQVPLLGVIPDASEDDLAKGVDLCHAVQQAPYSIISESYRQCRTNLKLSGPEDAHKVVLVTSGSAAEGKTAVAANLAAAFVAENSKVLLIDANFRQPSFEKLYPRAAGMGLEEETDAGFGLSSVLMGQCSHREAIRPSGIEGLDVIDGGLLPTNPAELLGGHRMAELLREQRRNYDYIVLDSAPVLLVSDAKMLAKLADATVVVFNAAATRRGAAVRTIRELRQVDAKIIGCVLLGVRALKGGYFQEQFKSYRRYQQGVQLAGAGA